jgi:hypothetical protein
MQRNRTNNEDLLNGIKQQISNEIKKQRELDNMRFRNQIDDIEKRRADINIERSKLYEELDYYNKIQKIDYLHKNLEKKYNLRKKNNSYNYNNQRYQNYPNSINYPRYAFSDNYSRNNIPSYILPPVHLNMNYPDKKQKENELIKLFVLKEMMDDNKKKSEDRYHRNRNQFEDYPRNPMYEQPKFYFPPPQQQQIQPTIIPQPQPIPVPQPIIIQSPPAMPSPNIIIQADRKYDTKKPTLAPKIPTVKKSTVKSKRTETK